MNKAKRQEIFERLRAANPQPTTELDFSSPFELLIAVILSAQATDKGVNKATARLFPVANTPEAIRPSGVDGLKHYIKTIGLFNSKAENIIKTCRMLIELHGGEVPADRAALEALPGVGRKTANVVLNTAFGQPTMAVDTHIFRVSNRTAHRAGQDRARGRKAPAAAGTEGVPAGCPPLADPARPLHLRGAQTALRLLPDRGPVRIPSEDRIARA